MAQSFAAKYRSNIGIIRLNYVFEDENCIH